MPSEPPQALQQEVIDAYKRMTQDYDRIIAQQPFFINCYALYAKLLDRILDQRQFERILDVGCGNGNQTVRLARHAKEVIGIDIAEDLMAVARERCRVFPNVTIQHEDARKMPFPDASFDCIFSYGDVLSHIIDGYERALAEISRVAKPGATISFEVDNKWHLGIFYHPSELWANLKTPGRGNTARFWEGLHFKTFTRPELVGLLDKYHIDLLEYHNHNALAALVPDQYVLEPEGRSLWGRIALALGKIDLAWSGRFPINRVGFNIMVIARKRA